MAERPIIREPHAPSGNGHGNGEGSGAGAGDLERWASMIGGGAVAVLGLSRRTWGGTALAVAGGSLVYRGVTGRWPTPAGIGLGTREGTGIHVERAVTINRSPEELYQFWRDFENLPRFMKHLVSVTRIDARHSHWVAQAPAGQNVEWDAEITGERENEWIAWRSIEGADVENWGEVRFQTAPGGRGTVVSVSLDYRPPAGRIGALVARLFGEEPQQQVADDLRRFKQLMEAGEIPTTVGQPHG